MDFFEHQEQARRRSGLLVLYFLLAILGIVGSIYFVVVAGLMFFGDPSPGQPAFDAWQPSVLATTAVISIAIILLGSGYKTLQLSAGGSAVARDLGGRPIDPATTDYDERKVLNVVEEMAIASGMPVPEVYILDDETSINAFAAGREPGDAVIGVTRGCIRLLSRDELQGVMAHEFSHILNGDMRLNMRLIGLLFGILFIAMIGRIVLRSASYSREKGAMVMLLLGLAVMAIGYAGLFFGKLIKAAVSREREYLADASAVQFTRNPDGIAGALKKIGGLSEGASISSGMAEEASHLFFGDSRTAGLGGGGLSTHPPLTERIRRVDPQWNGEFPKVTLPKIVRGPQQGQSTPRRAKRTPPPLPGLPHLNVASGASGAAAAASGMAPLEADAVRRSLDGLDESQVRYGEALREGFPESWVRAAHAQDSAQALVFALLLSRDAGTREHQMADLARLVEDEAQTAVRELAAETASLHSGLKLALVDLALPTLKRLSAPEYERFRELCRRLIHHDGQVDLFEFALKKVLDRHLGAYFTRRPPARIRYKQLAGLEQPAAVLLSTLAGIGTRDASERDTAFGAGASLLREGGSGPLSLLPPEQCGLDQIDKALAVFDQTTPLIKKRLLHAAGSVVMADGQVNSDEAELLRAIADAIGTPIPPFVPRQVPGT